MQLVRSYSIRGIREPIQRFDFSGRTVDFWSPYGAEHLIVTHDGQNIFDRKTSTNGFTWRIAQVSQRVFESHGYRPPAVIAVFHSGKKSNPNGRALDLAPQKFFEEGMRPTRYVPAEITLDQLQSDRYLDQVYDEIVPSLVPDMNVFAHHRRALLGSSMGGIATLYEMGRKPHRYGMGFAFSPHWTLVGDELVERMIQALPQPSQHKIWMSRGDKKLDGEYKPHQDLADCRMRELGWRGDSYETQVFRGAGHNERAWSRQVSPALHFWLEGSK